MEQSSTTEMLDFSTSSYNSKGPKRKKSGDDVMSDMPREISVAKFAEYRAKEIEKLTTAVMDYGTGQQIFQKLPKHMRRRAMSHSTKRLPRRLREIAKKQMGEVKKGKRPSRYYRRRPKNLLTEYNRRKRTKTWLETHIWHAKRFKMIEKWGYKIPLHPNDKGARAAYRATTQHCLLQDLSYYSCIEILGTEAVILQNLQCLTSSCTGPSFAAKSALSGSREGSTILYKKDQYPYGAICPVTFLWKPISTCAKNNESNTKTVACSKEAQRQLWIWVHPASYLNVFEEMLTVFNIPFTEKELRVANIMPASTTNEDYTTKGNQITNIIKNKQKSKTCKNLKETANVQMGNEKLQSFSNGCITVTSLKFELVRFRLVGPLSQAVLCDVLKVSDIFTSSNCADDIGNIKTDPKKVLNAGDSAEIALVFDSNNETQVEKAFKWWELYYTADQNRVAFDKQTATWTSLKSIQSPGELTPHAILGLTVRDPRMFLPSTKKKSMPSEIVSDTECSIRNIPPDVSPCPLWDASIRQEVKTMKITEHRLNLKRSQHLVPGTPLQLGKEESRIPILLIQNPGNQQTANHTKQSCNSSQNTLSNTSSGWDVILPSGWAMPFWIALVYHGARVGGLKEKANCTAEQGLLYYPNDFPDTPAGIETEILQKTELQEKYHRYPPAKRPNYFKFGVLFPFYSPWKQLISEWKVESEKFVNKIAIDSDQVSERWCVLRNRTILKCLSTHCTAVRLSDTDSKSTSNIDELIAQIPDCVVPTKLYLLNRGIPIEFSMVCMPTEDDLKLLQENSKYGGPIEPQHKDLSKTIKDVDPRENVINSCGRKIIGFVKQGSFSFGHGYSTGLAFCASDGLVTLLKQKQRDKDAVVLVRNTNSLQYRFASVFVVLAD